MYNAWGTRRQPLKDYLRASCDSSNSCIVRGLFSDAGGSFVAEWQVIHGVPMRTILSDSGDVMRTIENNLTPEVYE